MNKLTNEMARRAIVDGVPFLLSGPDGRIDAANQAFCELVGYSDIELQKMGRNKLSIDDDEPSTDVEWVTQLTSGEIQEYPQWQTLRHRYGNTLPGQMRFLRYPQGTSPLEYFLCFFTPFINGSKAAMQLAVEHIRDHTDAVKKQTETIAKLNGHEPTSQLRSMVDSALNWAWANPGKAWTIAGILYAADPFPTLKYLAIQRGWLPAQPVQIQLEDKKTGSYRAPSKNELQDIAHGNPIANVVAFKTTTVTTPNGASLTWSGDSVPAIRSLSGAAECVCGGNGCVGCCDSEGSDNGTSTDALRAIKDNAGNQF